MLFRSEKFFRIFFLAALGLSVSACQNAFRDFPNKSSDDYYFDQAQLAYNRFDFDTAIGKGETILASRPSFFPVIQLTMLAYAGRSGLRSLDLLLALTDLGSSTFFRVFAEHFPGATVSNTDDMASAIALLEGYQPSAALRTGDLNLIATLLYYGRIGVILNRYAYDSTNSVVAGFDACSTGSLPDAEVQNIVRSLARALDATAYISGSASDVLGGLSSIPELAPLLAAQNAVCPTDSLQCSAMRAVINEGDAGIGIGSGPVAACP